MRSTVFAAVAAARSRPSVRAFAAAAAPIAKRRQPRPSLRPIPPLRKPRR